MRSPSPTARSGCPPSRRAEDNPPPAVLEIYSEGGFDIDEDFQELPDHVAVELEFLYLLTFTQNQARQAGDSDALAASEQLQQRFLDAHLGAWIGPFAAAVQAGAETPFYRVLATLTERFVRDAVRRADDALTRRQPGRRSVSRRELHQGLGGAICDM